MKKQIFTGIRLLFVMIILTGGVYPGIVTVISNLAFREKAQGSLVRKDGRIIGSELIGQNFDSDSYFQTRPSANNYNSLPSGGSNLGQMNPVLIELASERSRDFRLLNRVNEKTGVPSEMITSSGSGLDPHISPMAALLQVKRVAEARAMDQAGEDKITRLISTVTEKPQFLILGKPRINVFRLNLILDTLK
jgi:K+-transporting ATPase ATPase C chain